MTTDVNDPVAAMEPLMAECRAIIDKLEALGEQEQPLRQRKSEIELELLRFSESSGLQSFSSSGLSCNIQEKTRATYAPDKWNEILAWAVQHGAETAIQRRLSDARIVEIATSGTPLPEGIKLEPYSYVALRRK